MGHSAFGGVHELQPGEILAIDASGVGVETRFMAVPESCLDDYGDTAEAVATFRELFDTAVRNRLPSRGSAACMLSGGMDSGPIAESATRQLSVEGPALRPISWRLPAFPDADESGWIRTLCRHLDLEPQWFTPACLPYGVLDGRMISPDWPTFNPYRHLVNTCYQMTAESGCRIVFNGNAGDDLYVPIRQLYRGYWKGGEMGLIWRDAARIFSQGGLSALLSHSAVRHELGRLRPDWRKARPPKWLHPRAHSDWFQVAEAQPRFDSFPLPEYAEQLLGPRMTSGRCHEQYFAALHGVERRDPFHDESLVGFMLQAPVSFSVREGRTKWIMREAMRGRIPDPFRLKRRTGLLGSYSRAGIEAHKDSLCRLLFEESAGWQNWVKPEVVRQALDSSGQSGGEVLTRCVGYALWAQHWDF